MRPPWHYEDAGISQQEIEETLQPHREHQAQLAAWGADGATETELRLLKKLWLVRGDTDPQDIAETLLLVHREAYPDPSTRRPCWRGMPPQGRP
jgi:hypothetical protein